MHGTVTQGITQLYSKPTCTNSTCLYIYIYNGTSLLRSSDIRTHLNLDTYSLSLILSYPLSPPLFVHPHFSPPLSSLFRRNCSKKEKSPKSRIKTQSMHVDLEQELLQQYKINIQEHPELHSQESVPVSLSTLSFHEVASQDDLTSDRPCNQIHYFNKTS